jgi:hypothetical protein
VAPNPVRLVEDSGEGAVKWNRKGWSDIGGGEAQFWWLLAWMKGAKWRSAQCLPLSEQRGDKGERKWGSARRAVKEEKGENG